MKVEECDGASWSLLAKETHEFVDHSIGSVIIYDQFVNRRIISTDPTFGNQSGKDEGGCIVWLQWVRPRRLQVR